MRSLLSFAWRDLRASGGSLWIFFACLTLGVALVSGAGGIHTLIQKGLLSDTRALMGGDLEIDVNQPLPPEAIRWMQERGEVSLVTELNTMLETAEGEFVRVELQSNDINYPLYGELQLQPDRPLADITRYENQHWGVALDPVIAAQSGVRFGDMVTLGGFTVEVRALIREQPDRNLNANWRGLPILIAPQAIEAAGLIQPGSNVDYEYRVKTAIDTEVWRQAFYQAFPDAPWELRTFKDRSDRIAQRLGQIGSGLLIIALSTLFVGGLGVFNSIQAYLSRKQKTIATLMSIGLRNRGIATVYLLQTFILSGLAGLLGVIIGTVLAAAGASVIETELPVTVSLGELWQPLGIAWLFGLLTAFTFALPAVGKTVAVDPATLFRGNTEASRRVPGRWLIASAVCAVLLMLLVISIIPDVRFGLAFIAVIIALIAMLEWVVRAVQHVARRIDQQAGARRSFALSLALSSLYRPGTPLRSSLISLGSALTLLVACTLVVAGLLRAVNSTIPDTSPALVLYDVFPDQLETVSKAVQATNSFERIDMAPLVRGRMTSLNGTPLSALSHLDAAAWREAIEDDYKLSYSANNIDKLTLLEGQWPQYMSEGAWHLALEDREAGELGIKLDDTVTFTIAGSLLKTRVVGIYSQKGIQTRFWFEGILAQGALDDFTKRFVGAAYLSDQEAIQLQKEISRLAPNVITVRTETILGTARDLLAKAAAGLTLIAAISLLASLLVLSSIMATGWTRQIYTATILHSLGSRLSVIGRALHLEYLVLAIITSLYAILLGSLIALPLLSLRMKLPIDGLVWLGACVAIVTSVTILALSAAYFMKKLSIVPADLLKDTD